jgi:hypothetical protein
LDLSGAQAPGADPNLADALGRLGLDVLKVRLPLFRRSFMGMADAVPEHRALTAIVAYFRHDRSLLLKLHGRTSAGSILGRRWSAPIEMESYSMSTDTTSPVPEAGHSLSLHGLTSINSREGD